MEGTMPVFVAGRFETQQDQGYKRADMSSALTLVLPTHIFLPRKTKEDKIFRLNLNVYRNTCHMVLNQAKEIYHNIVAGELSAQSWRPLQGPVSVSVGLWLARSNTDLANVACIVEKFAVDAVVACGVIPDDKSSIVQSGSYHLEGYAPKNPRAVFTVKETR